jgi:sarcosine oxidase subunit alpha
MATLTPARARTPLHAWHAAHGARFTETDGWLVVAGYDSAEREAEAARARFAFADISAFAKVSLLGRDTEGPQPGGAVLDFGVLTCRLTPDQLLMLALTPDGAAATGDVLRQDVTSAYAAFLLLGPHVEDVLRQLTSFDVSARAFPDGTCAETGVAGVQALLVRVPGMSLTTVYLGVAWDVGEYVWERLLEVGRACGGMAIGHDALRGLLPTTTSQS